MVIDMDLTTLDKKIATRTSTPEAKVEAIHAFLAKHGWMPHDKNDVIGLGTHEGYTGDGRFGTRVGPIKGSIDGALHEMAHAVVAALDDECWRLTENSFGLTIKSGQWIAGIYYPEPQTGQPTKLETRVIGVQRVIAQSCGLHPDAAHLQESAKALDFMPDSIFWREGDD